MREIPECLNRRYKALDDLIKDLTVANQGGNVDQRISDNNMGIKLMCDFWNILKDNPGCDLKQEVRHCMGVETRQNSGVSSRRVDCCYNMSNKDDKTDGKSNDPMTRIKHVCCDPKSDKVCETGIKPTSATSSTASEKAPLSKVINNLNEAVSFEKKCTVRVSELVAAQKQLTAQIQNLEQREKEGVKLLKQADCMWSCMEETYKKKVADSLDRQKILLKELKEVEASANKWRKTSKDLDWKIKTFDKKREEITEKLNEKTNDVKVMDIELVNIKTRLQCQVGDIEEAKVSLEKKRENSDAKLASIATEMTKLQSKVEEQIKMKNDKIKEGTQYVKDAREDLQKICRVLLTKKLENEDLLAEKEALLHEAGLLRKTCDTCKDKCKSKEGCLAEQLKKLDDEIAEFKKKCVKCHECIDTSDVRNYCTDCPRCLKERECLYDKDHCSPDRSMDCVCMNIKHKFLDNVFDNMYTVLERQSKTSPGKAVADAVLNCLKRSRNGKLDEATRKMLQEFILTTVKKNLNLTIVGGAVKTRCEMDPETYKQLMLCLKDVDSNRPIKEDKGTVPKKEPCQRWGSHSECYCPKDPKGCVCTKRAPPPANEPNPCPPPEKDDAATAGKKTCPFKKNASCGPDCGLQQEPQPDAVGAEVAEWRPTPCAATSCALSGNMRAAQCVLGPEPLANLPHVLPTPPVVPNTNDIDKTEETCSCGDKKTKPCLCQNRKSRPRQRIIEEVMGRYTEVAPIEKVASEHDFDESNRTRRLDAGCDCSNLPIKYLLASNISDNKISRFCACSSNYISEEGRKPFLEKLSKKGHINICRNSTSDYEISVNESKKSSPFQNNVLRNKSDNDIKVILCPKFPHKICDDKIELSLCTSHVCSMECVHRRMKNKSSVKSGRGLTLCDASIVGRKVCETVEKLVKDIVVPDELFATDLSSSDVEWVTVSSLFNEISSLTKLERRSSETVNEVEVNCETLEASKDFRLIDGNEQEGYSTINKKNVLEMQQEAFSYDKHANSQISKSIYYIKEKGHNMAGKGKKTKLLDDIRQIYNVSVDTSIEDPELNVQKLKNIRKCLHNLGETTLQQTKCNCNVSKHPNKYDYNYHLKKTKKYLNYQMTVDNQTNASSCEFDELRKCLLAITRIGKDDLHQKDTKVRFDTKMSRCYARSNKAKSWDKKNK